MEIPQDIAGHMTNCTLRYSLGSSNYITGLTSDMLKRLPAEVWDERTWVVAMRDLRRYFEDRKQGRIRDDECDYEAWKKLYDYLLPMYDAEFRSDYNIIVKEKK